MLKQVKLFSIFPIILIVSLVVGIASNLFGYQNPKASCVVILLSLLIGASYYVLRDRIHLSRPTMSKLIMIDLALILLIQLIVLHFFPASVFHDPFRVLSQAELISRHHFDWGVSTYFWRYPNNVPLVFLLAKWFQLTNLVGMSTNVALQLLSILFLDGFIGLALVTVARKTTRSPLFLFLLTFFLVSPFAYTYYLQVFYSDLPSLLFLLIGINILDQWQGYNQRRKIGMGTLLFVIMLLGQLVKPNLIVIVAAIVIFVGLMGFTRRSLLKGLLIPLALMTVGIGAAFPTAHVIQSSIHYTQKSQYTMPAINWVWMSYNPQHKGTYVSHDIQKMNQLPNKAARSQYLKPALIKRLSTLGPAGIIHRWFTKMWILLGVGNIQKAYTAGFVQTPQWYSQWKKPVSLASSIVMRASFVALYTSAIFSSWALLKRQRDDSSVVPMFATIVAVGYVAFHVLVWETESRYGQVLFPLLVFLDAAMSPVLALSPQTSQRQLHLRLGFISTLILGSTIAGVLFTSSMSFFPHSKPIIATQSSELSLQYNAKLEMIDKNTTVTQDIQLDQPASNVSLFMPAKGSFDASLINTQTRRVYPFIDAHHRFTVHQYLPAGRYRIVVNSDANHNPNLEITTTMGYQLAPYPLKINGVAHPHSSFIYVVKGATVN